MKRRNIFYEIKDEHIFVVIDENQELTPEQKSILDKTLLDKTLGGYEFITVPVSGWTIEEQDQIFRKCLGYPKHETGVVFVSNLAYMLCRFAYAEGWDGSNGGGFTRLFIFNDCNQELELVEI